MVTPLWIILELGRPLRKKPFAAVLIAITVVCLTMLFVESRLRNWSRIKRGYATQYKKEADSDRSLHLHGKNSQFVAGGRDVSRSFADRQGGSFPRMDGISAGLAQSIDYTPLKTCAALSVESDHKHQPVKDETSDKDVITELKKGCESFKARYHFITTEHGNLTKEEEDFPIAYSMLIHQNIHQVSMLLSAIYRRHNFYCIHPDAKSDTATHHAVQLLTGCFNNVFKSSKIERVVYGSFERLQADINCMRDLLLIKKSENNWKYLLNLCGQDFPLRTNLEIVQQLKALQGKNSIGATKKLDKYMKRRYEYIHELQNVTKGGKTVEQVVNLQRKYVPPPLNMTIVKNSAYNVYTREFLQWALVDSLEGAVLLEWLRSTYSPDENYWSMLNILPQASGGANSISMGRIAHLVSWSFSHNRDCHGYWRHDICVFGGKDLPWLLKMNRNRLFANKFDVTYDVTPVHCLRNALDERTEERNSSTNAHRIPVKMPNDFLGNDDEKSS